MSSNVKQNTNTREVPETRTFESPTDLLSRILKTGTVMSMAETGSRIPPPFPIPVLTPAEYYSLTSAERENYHKLQQMFNGKVEVPGLVATMPAQGENPVLPNSMNVGVVSRSASAPATRAGSPAVARRGQSWPGSGGSSDAESATSSEEGTIVVRRLSRSEYKVFAKRNSSSSDGSSVYDEEYVDSEESLKLVGRPLPAEYEEFAKGNPYL